MSEKQEKELKKFIAEKKVNQKWAIASAICLIIAILFIPFYEWTVTLLPNISAADVYSSTRNMMLYDYQHAAKLGIVFFTIAGGLLSLGLLILALIAISYTNDNIKRIQSEANEQ